MLFFQLDDGLGHPRLRGVQGFGRFSQVEVSAGGFLDEAKLVQVHIIIVIWMICIMLYMSD